VSGITGCARASINLAIACDCGERRGVRGAGSDEQENRAAITELEHRQHGSGQFSRSLARLLISLSRARALCVRACL